MNYEAGVYTATYRTALGKSLWVFLNEKESVIRLKTATSMERPALEALEERLLERFGAEVLDDRVKQMIGHMTRQIMEREGYVVDIQNVRMTNGAPFSKATRYKLPGEVTYHLFKKGAEQREYAVTLDKSGKGLPPGKWHYVKAVRGDLRLNVACGVAEPRKARAEIAATGHHVFKMPRALRAPG